MYLVPIAGRPSWSRAPELLSSIGSIVSPKERLQGSCRPKEGANVCSDASLQPAMNSGPGPIVVAGSHGQSLFLRVDAIPREGETVLATGFGEPEDGGKATNQAVAIAKLEVPVRLVTLLGNDSRGERWHRILTRYGVDTHYVLKRQGATDVGFVMLAPTGVPAIASSRDLSLFLDDEMICSVATAFSDASIVICQLEAPQSCAKASFRLGREAGAVTILNPAPTEVLEPELMSLTNVIVPNQHEAAALVGRPLEPWSLAAELAKMQDWSVIVTAGADGCFVAENSSPDPVHLPASKVTVRDTTGAGDSFVGALACRMRAGDSLLRAAIFATKAASLSVTRDGTLPAYPVAADLNDAVDFEP
jgi:ribokinase